MVEQLENLSKEHLISEVINHHSKVVEKESEIVQLKHQINLLQKALFGQKKEVHKAIVSPDQVRLEFGEKVDLDLAQDIELLKITYHRKKAPKKREDFSKLALPDDLPREVVVIEPQDKTGQGQKLGSKLKVDTFGIKKPSTQST